MHKTMKYKTLIFSILAVITLMLVSCEKNKTMMEYVSGDDKDKIDLKGSMMKPDMKYENIYAELVEKVVYVYFNETVENCAMTLTARNGDVLYARRVSNNNLPRCASLWAMSLLATINSTSPTAWTRPRAGSTSTTTRKSK